MLWFDIEGASQYWSSDHQSNIDFFEAMKTEVNALGVHAGVYTSKSQWEPIFGTGYDGGSSFPIWYAHYDGEPTFADFSPFGGWSHPSIKQFSDQGNKCGTSYDINWYPA